MVDVTTYSEARQTLAKLMDRVVKDNEPVIVARRKRGSVVLVSLAEWNSLQETLHLVSTRANARALFDAIDDLNAGKGVAMTSEQLDAVVAGTRQRKPSRPGPRRPGQAQRDPGKVRRRAKKVHREAAE
jgi:antitoxin YefM